MSLHLLRLERIGETRAVACDDEGRELRLFLSRPWQNERFLWCGRTVEAVLRTHDAAAGGAFLDTALGQSVFMRTSAKQKALPEGTRLSVIVEAEARADKLARVREMTDPAGEPYTSPWSAWLASLPSEPSETVLAETPQLAEYLDGVFGDALQPDCSLPGGGRITLSPTPALTAVDVDSAGRASTGDRRGFSSALNKDAVTEAARQFALRDIGGLAVLDCVSPLGRDDGGRMKSHFSRAWKALSKRKALVLPPSPFGLMEFSLAWGVRPLRERLMDERGAMTTEARALDAIETLRRGLLSQRGASFVLSVPADVKMWLEAAPFDWRGDLAARFGGRFALDAAPSDKVKLAAS